MSDDTAKIPEGMPDDIKSEYGEILSRLDEALVHAPDPKRAQEWIPRACALKMLPNADFSKLTRTERESVRNEILYDLLLESYMARKHNNPSEDEGTAWHLAVRRSVLGYLNYEEAEKADKSLNDVPLVHKRVRLKSGKNTLTFTVDKKPMRVEIDRDHLFIDRVMDDNGKKVDVE